MSRIYRKSPIIEVVCEFQFGAESPWDQTIPGLFYDRIKNTFPRKATETLLTVQLPAGVAVLPGTMMPFQPEALMRFSRSDGQSFVRLGRHLLSVNQLEPYPSWKEVWPLIQQSLEAYIAIAEPTDIHRIGLRYINRIPIAEGHVQPADYFRLYPQMSDELPQTYAGFTTQVLFPYAQERDALKIELTSGTAEAQGTLVALLDLDYFLAQPGTVKPEQAHAWVQNAHDAVEQAFEACLTERLKQHFEPKEQ